MRKCESVKNKTYKLVKKNSVFPKAVTYYIHIALYNLNLSVATAINCKLR